MMGLISGDLRGQNVDKNENRTKKGLPNCNVRESKFLAKSLDFIRLLAYKVSFEGADFVG